MNPHQVISIAVISLASAFFATHAEGQTIAEIIDFESGSAHYDNRSPQLTGRFRDMYNGGAVNLSNNGPGNNNYLQLTSGNPATVIYDSSPGETGGCDTFSLERGQKLTLSVEVLWSAGSVAGGLNLGFFNNSSTAANIGAGGMIGYNVSGTNTLSFRALNSLTENTNVSLVGSIKNTVYVTGTAYRFEVTLELLDDSRARITEEIYSLINGFNSEEDKLVDSHQYTFALGTGANQIDLDPASLSFYFRSNQSNSTGMQLDNFGYRTIPEPGVSTALLLGFPMLALSRRFFGGKR